MAATISCSSSGVCRSGVANQRDDVCKVVLLLLLAQVEFAGCGDRFAAVGEGGLLATWRLDAPKRGALGRADWALQVRRTG